MHPRRSGPCVVDNLAGHVEGWGTWRKLGGILTEVVARGGKGNAVRDLLAETGIDPDCTAAIGDELNDEALLDEIGRAHV